LIAACTEVDRKVHGVDRKVHGGRSQGARRSIARHGGRFQRAPCVSRRALWSFAWRTLS